jgi:hypothetical protein
MFKHSKFLRKIIPTQLDKIVLIFSRNIDPSFLSGPTGLTTINLIAQVNKKETKQSRARKRHISEMLKQIKNREKKASTNQEGSKHGEESAKTQHNSIPNSLVKYRFATKVTVVSHTGPICQCVVFSSKT